MNSDFFNMFLISLFSLITSIALFLTTIRFGDHIIAWFQKEKRPLRS